MDLVLACVLLMSAEDAKLELADTLSLGPVQGRIDHLAFDPRTDQLFLAALGHGAVEILSVANKSSPPRAIDELQEPQGVVALADAGELVLTTGGDGTCRFHRLGDLREMAKIDLGDDADNIRFDPAHQRLYVGYGDGALAVIDASARKRLANIPLGGHPESFQLERSGPRVFVNVPSRKAVLVVDREKQSVIATWPLERAQANFPMALDEQRKHLHVVCRQPARLLTLDTDSGRVLSDVPCSGDADDIFLDAKRGRAYISCGEGFLDVFALHDGDAAPERITRLSTAAGARTCLWVPDKDALYLAVPQRGDQHAEVRIYRPR
jgi:hypothetical protein